MSSLIMLDSFDDEETIKYVLRHRDYHITKSIHRHKMLVNEGKDHQNHSNDDEGY